MADKLKGFDQITAWVAGVSISALLFTGLWYTGKNISKNITAAEAEMVEGAQKELAALTAKQEQETKQKMESPINLELGKSTDHLTPGKLVSSEETWGYVGNLAPWYWGKLNPAWSRCGATAKQSPIDISGAKLDERLKSLKFNYKHGLTRMTLHHSTVQGDIQTGSYLEWNGERFDLTRVFFRTPSEHRVNGLPWEMELQLEHKSSRDQTIMIAVLITSGSPSPLLKEIAGRLPRFREDVTEFTGIKWDTIYPQIKTYWMYEGTTTIPPCAPEVTWLVFTNTVATSASDIDLFVKTQKSNVRPPFPLGNRRLTRSNR